MHPTLKRNPRKGPWHRCLLIRDWWRRARQAPRIVQL